MNLLMPFLESLVLVAIAAPAGAGVLALMALPAQGWRATLRGWWYMTLLFLALGAVAAAPSLLTGERSLRGSCPGAIFGYGCY